MNLLKNISEKLSSGRHEESSSENIDNIPDKNKLAKELMYILIDATKELIPENQNAIIQAHNTPTNGSWDNYIKDLVHGKSPIFYIDNGGISRMNYYRNELSIVHSGEMPSKIPGKTIQEVWTDVKNDYNPKICKLMNELNIQ